MKLLMALLLGLSTGLAAAKAPVPELLKTPVVDEEQAAVDEDLIAAKPGTVTAAPEPDMSMKGRKGISLGTDFSNLSLGLAWWLTDTQSLRLNVGGAYENSTNDVEPVVPNSGDRALQAIQVDLGSRHLWPANWEVGYAFVQLGLGYSQTDTKSVSNWQRSGSSWSRTDVTSSERLGHVRLGLGVELFWPSRRDVSFEASSSGDFAFGQTASSTLGYTNDPVTYPALLALQGTGVVRRFGMSSQNILTKLNFYFR